MTNGRELIVRIESMTMNMYPTGGTDPGTSVSVRD